MSMRHSDLDTTYFTRPRSQHAHQSASGPFCTTNGPIDPAGRRFDLSDRPLLCSSSNMRNEVIVGGSDHALYAIDVIDPRRQPITMYTKTCGHTDWVTSVTHLADGQVLSAAMDGKLCLWSNTNRRSCIDLIRNSTHPISKVMSDVRYNSAISLCYDGNIEIWKFSDSFMDPDDHSGSSSSSSMVSSSRRPSGSAGLGSRSSYTSRVISPANVLTGAHSQPVLEAAYHDTTLATGDKAGSLVVWDIERGQALTRFRAHPSPISALLYEEESRTITSAGTDGFVKVWDPRSSGSGMVFKVPVFAQSQQSSGPSGMSMGASSSYSGGSSQRIGMTTSAVRGGRGSSSSTALTRGGGSASAGRGRSNPALATLPQGQVMSGGSPISVMAGMYGRGSTDLSYLVVGGGSPDDSRLCILDPRSSYQPIEYLNHHRNGIYSICIVGDDAIFTGDGVGTLMCHNIQNLLRGGPLVPRQCLRYGLGATEQGAIRGINCVNGKIVTTGEDGKVLVFDYA